MKIAIVSPSPIPFTIGGIENLSWGLCEAINQEAGCQCELIKLPTKEHDFWGLIQSYYNFYHLDVSHFDAVICMKYPAWMIQHSNCIIYMAHCLRGLYDTYGNKKLPLEVAPGNEDIDMVLNYMKEQPVPETLEPFFTMLFSLKEKNTIPAEYFAFPGAFIRKIIHYLDNYAFVRNQNHTFYSISETVKKRWEYFPADKKINVVYPPTTVRQCHGGNYEYLFMVSRLDAPKRIDMLIRAMHYVKSDIKLYIAGTGPMEAELKRLAGGDERIVFLGYVKDEDISQWYSNSLVIPYFPYDEDYGLITIEAMLHKKPVITTEDAGGPTEFVVNNETGFVTTLAEREIAAKIDYLVEHPEDAKRMGENAFNKVKGITWEYTVQQLLKEIHADEKLEANIEVNKENKENKEKRKKLTLAISFPVYPPTGGGQTRIYHLYKNMSEQYDIDIISFTNAKEPAFEERIASNLWEKRIPKSSKHQLEEDKLKQEFQVSVGDVAMFDNSKYTLEYGTELEHSIATSDGVIVCHPYLYYEVKKYIGDKPFIYEAQDVEYLIKKQMFPDTEHGKRVLQQVYEAEKKCCEESVLILACSEADKKALCELYHIAEEKVVVAPNGVAVEDSCYLSVEQRLENKKTMRLQDEIIGVFMGSGHKPNYEACEHILTLADKLPHVTFLIIGTLCAYFEEHQEEYQIPQNVGMLGLVSEQEKQKLFSVVDFALNPMTSGSGTNLKLFDYMAAGVPVITTEFGTRGVAEKDCFLIADVNEMETVIREYKLDAQKTRVERAREIVEQEFSWHHISEEVMKQMAAPVH